MSQDLDQQVRKAVADFCRQAPRRYPFFTILMGILLLVLIIWYIPLWQVPVSGLSLKDRLHQINENRKTVAQIVGGVFILVGLYIAWVRSKAMRDQAEVDREQQLTDLYVKAVEQLGNRNIHIRLGGIYALERIARESPKDHWPIMEVLSAFVRENAYLLKKVQLANSKEEEVETTPEAVKKNVSLSLPMRPRPFTQADIQAVLTVLGRTAMVNTFGQKRENRYLDLVATDLVKADLRHANLEFAVLIKSNLQNAFGRDANFGGAVLMGANLKGVLFEGVNFHGADLCKVNLNKADLRNANFQYANLDEADLRGANLQGATGLTPEQVANAIWNKATHWPDGFSPPTSRKEEDNEEE